MRPKASWAIDSEPIRARGIIAKYELLRHKLGIMSMKMFPKIRNHGVKANSIPGPPPIS